MLGYCVKCVIDVLQATVGSPMNGNQESFGVPLSLVSNQHQTTNRNQIFSSDSGSSLSRTTPIQQTQFFSNVNDQTTIRGIKLPHNTVDLNSNEGNSLISQTFGQTPNFNTNSLDAHIGSTVVGKPLPITQNVLFKNNEQITPKLDNNQVFQISNTGQDENQFQNQNIGSFSSSVVGIPLAHSFTIEHGQKNIQNFNRGQVSSFTSFSQASNLRDQQNEHQNFNKDSAGINAEGVALPQFVNVGVGQNQAENINIGHDSSLSIGRPLSQTHNVVRGQNQPVNFNTADVSSTAVGVPLSQTFNFEQSQKPVQNFNRGTSSSSIVGTPVSQTFTIAQEHGISQDSNSGPAGSALPGRPLSETFSQSQGTIQTHHLNDEERNNNILAGASESDIFSPAENLNEQTGFNTEGRPLSQNFNQGAGFDPSLNPGQRESSQSLTHTLVSFI